MKRLVMVLVAWMAMMTTAMAQLKDTRPVTQLQYGVTAGLNISQMNYDASQTIKDMAKNKAGFLVGPTLVFTMPRIGFGADLSALFDYRRGTIDDVSVKSTSIQVPLNLRYGIDFADILTVFAFAGPQFVYYVGNSASDVLGAEWRHNKSNIGLNFGLGIVAMEQVQVRLSYNMMTKNTGEFVVGDAVKGTAKANSVQMQVSVFL